MGESISTAIIVSLIGMVTVFIILGLVVLTGKVLIRIVNTFFPIHEIEPATPLTSASPNNQTPKKSFNKSTLAAIITSVDTVTFGKGKVNRIEKIN